MPVYLAPGVFVEELTTGGRPIEAVNTTMAAFVGKAPWTGAPKNRAIRINGYREMLGRAEYFHDNFVRDATTTTPLAQAVYGFFLNGGSVCYVVNTGSDTGDITGGGIGLDQLTAIDEIAMVAAPGRTDAASQKALLRFAETRGDLVALLDGPGPEPVRDIAALTRVDVGDPADAADPGFRPPVSERGFGAFYYPWITMRDPIETELAADGTKRSKPMPMPPSGAMAGIWARTDRARGVHKAPAGVEARLAEVSQVTHVLTRTDQETLNPAGVNLIRGFSPEGILCWGARTLAPSASEWRYLNVRRLFIMVEKSILRATNWVVFEPNDRPLWQMLRRDIGDFLTRVWESGALKGATREEAFFVRCDDQTNTREAIDAGIVTTVIGLAPVKPAEFVVFRIGQSAGGATIAQV